MSVKIQQKELKKQVAPYEKSETTKSIIQLANTIIPYFVTWYLAYKALSFSYLLTLVLCIITAGFMIRTFIIFHDCTHHSFFKSRKWNKIVGTFTGILTMFPYAQWGRDHNIHHASSGNLDKRGTGDIWVMTVEEYAKASSLDKFKYRMYRNPLVMFGLGPIWLVIIKSRFNRKGARMPEKMNTWITNAGIVAISALLIWAIGWKAFMMIEFPILFIAGSLGIWLFYIQHTFEDSYFEHDKEWEYVQAAVEGSSFYKLPKVLQWVTGNIGFHHVHHLAPRVPNYKLEEVHKNTKPLQHVPTVTLSTSLESLKFRLWDEEKKRFVGYSEAKTFLKERSGVSMNPKTE
ncbi:fatty acid desaturase [Bacillus sp. FJAT-18017]|uniref:fatty acid desaturase n=1 Tax=Bacillus sp. FJAT-18017 TaxID=1705566 RepID=UPI0006AF019E|nr:fatty acid desaturase [Bacillus sp. FJAT-18017]ALC90471.1 fatty acid desaturase [Bacillus sp. FJAT-18017]